MSSPHHAQSQKAPAITLTTDFGLAGPYVASMKGVILGILPGANIVDLSHTINPQDIYEAAYVLDAAAPFFPTRTVHVVVVDPGVGSDRRALALFTREAVFVGPDNGVFSLILTKGNVTSIRELSNPTYHLPVISHTFHGRDIFAPVAAHIASGIPPSALGPELTDPVTVPFASPQQDADGSIRGQITFVDAFGNLISNIPAQWLQDQPVWEIEIAGARLEGPRTTYSLVRPGELILLVSSTGFIEIAVREGSAARRLQVKSGEHLSVRPRS